MVGIQSNDNRYAITGTITRIEQPTRKNDGKRLIGTVNNLQTIKI